VTIRHSPAEDATCHQLAVTTQHVVHDISVHGLGVFVTQESDYLQIRHVTSYFDQGQCHMKAF